MAANYAEVTGIEGRSETRDEVFHRARAITPDGGVLPLLIVNISPHGLMARCDVAYEPGQTLQVDLPLVGRVTAHVRWSLGGRIGCRIDPPIPAARYYAVVAAMG